MKTFSLIFFFLLTTVTQVYAVQQAVEAPQAVFKGGLNTAAIKACEKAVAPLCKAKNSFDYPACMQQQMTGRAGCEQSLAFLKLAQGFPKKIRHYPNVDVVYAQIYAADRDSAFFMVSHAGELVPLNWKVDITSLSGYDKLLQQYPNLFLYSFTDGNNFPKVNTLADGSEQVVFKQVITEQCVACKEIAVANIAYQFGKNGKFIKSEAISLQNK